MNLNNFIDKRDVDLCEILENFKINLDLTHLINNFGLDN